MKEFREYTELSRRIHAPEELKERTLWRIKTERQTRPEEKTGKKKPGRYSRGFGVMRKAAVAAAVALILVPATAYASQKFLLGDAPFLKKNDEKVESLINTYPQETAPAAPGETKTPENANDYAAYRVAEALCDSSSLYLVAEISPVNDKYLLVPRELGFNEPVSQMRIDGLEGVDENMTIEDYAASLGKIPASVWLDYRCGGREPEGGWSSICTKEGKIYQYFTGKNPAGTENFTLNCTGNVLTDAMWESGDLSLREAQKVAFDIQVSDKSSRTPVKEFTRFEEMDIGITVHSALVERTELGTYVTFRYTPTDPEMASCFFEVRDSQGNFPGSLAGYDSTSRDNGDGSYSVTAGYQNLDSLENLSFRVCGMDFEYGPFQILG